MKKLLTLFVSFIIVSFSFAQYGAGNEDNYSKQRNAEYSERFKKDKDGNWRAHSNWKYERDMEVERINRDYDRKIQSVQSRWFINGRKKQRLIRELEENRRDEIRTVFEKYKDGGKNRFQDGDRNW